jgi:hypothetical protein
LKRANLLVQLSVSTGAFWTPKPLLGDGLDPSGIDVLLAERQDPQQGQGLLRFLERGHVLQDLLGFAVQHDDQRLSPLCELV